MGGDFIKQFLDVLWAKFKVSLGLDPSANLGDTVTTFGTKLGDTIGQALYDAITNKLNQAWNNFIDSLAIVKGQNMGEWGYDPFKNFAPAPPAGNWQPYEPSFGNTEQIGGANKTAASGSTYHITINTNDQGTIRKLRELGVAI